MYFRAALRRWTSGLLLTLAPVGIPWACSDGSLGTTGEACTSGETEYCHPSPALAGKGACSYGQRSCVGGLWTDCVGAVLPTAEDCDTGADDDCDGVANEGCPCEPGQTRSCYTGGAASEGKGACVAGNTTCVDGTWGDLCEGEVIPASVESCDGIDDDCDGSVDEGCACEPGSTRDCYSHDDATANVGACKVGAQLCVNTSWGACEGEVGPEPESCNGIDDDCDGELDEGNPGGGAACSSGSPNACGPGAFVCEAGKLVCEEGTIGEEESCNGIDDDCDGKIDNGDPGGGEPCDTGDKGECAPGLSACDGGKLVCVALTGPTPETCNGVDDDCDGKIDNGDPGGGGACDSGKKGACAAGTLVCQSGDLVCEADSEGSAEACNGIDDDCDGEIDEGNPGGGGTCDSGEPGVCSAGLLACEQGKLVCNPKSTGGSEKCNGFDDDCDGEVDEGNPGGGGGCNTGLLGLCGAGYLTCADGKLLCEPFTKGSAETCNGFDDDCNGVDDDFVIDCPNQCFFGKCDGIIP